ncbi:MAG: DUF3343 domain-containing protein [Clostridioides sp.]|jgi:hypothetical protein|nr:DUF3343 domain-containing protein [Clostridioides sp.]
MKEMYVVSFNSTHHAIRSEKLLKENEMKIQVLPTPREISASCGLSISFVKDDLEDIRELLKENSIDYRGMYCILKKEDGKRDLIELN